MYDEKLEHRIDGAVFVDGSECKMWFVQDRRAKLAYKSDIRLMSQFKNGGQSSNRLQRIREENRQSFISDISAKVLDVFYDHSCGKSRVTNLVLFGPSRFKEEVANHKKQVIAKYINIHIATACDLDPILEMIDGLENPEEANVREEYETLIMTADPKLVFGDQIKSSLENCALAKLVISEDFDISKYEVDYGLELVTLRTTAAIDWIDQYGGAIGLLWYVE